MANTGAKMAAKQVNPRVIWTVSMLLALLFAVVGVLLLLKPQAADQVPGVDKATGLLLVRAIAAVICLGAVLLLVPRLAWIGALLLGIILIGVIGAYATSGALLPTVIPILILISLGTLGYARRPGAVPAAAVKKDTVEPTPVTPPSGSGSSTS
jgi:hypothetical protein